MNILVCTALYHWLEQVIISKAIVIKQVNIKNYLEREEIITCRKSSVALQKSPKLITQLKLKFIFIYIPYVQRYDHKLNQVLKTICVIQFSYIHRRCKVQTSMGNSNNLYCQQHAGLHNFDFGAFYRKRHTLNCTSFYQL